MHPDLIQVADGMKIIVLSCHGKNLSSDERMQRHAFMNIAVSQTNDKPAEDYALIKIAGKR